MKVASEAPTRAPGADGADGHVRTTTVRQWLAIVMGLAIAAAVVLRFVARSDLWLDEALSVNVARLPLDQIPDWLRHDGAPPLYYVLLHFWTGWFGTGDVAARSLSGIFSVATLPAMWFAGRRLGGRPVAWASLLLLAASPFAIRFATESRMYAMQMLFVVLGYLALARLLERPTLGRQAVVAVLTALLLYTQYWSLYLLAVVAVLLVVEARRAQDVARRRSARSAIVAMIAGGITFLPWIPTFLYQNAHTGTPWGDPVFPTAALGFTLRDFSGGPHSEAYTLLVLLVALLVLSLFGRGLDRYRIEIDVRTRPGVRTETVVWLGVLFLGATLSLATGNTFAGRYASVIYPIFVLVIAYSVTVFPDPRVRAAVLAIVVAIGFVGGVRNAVEQRTQAFQTADIIRSEARPGDVVLYCPDQVGPAVSRLLRGQRRLDQLTFPRGDAPELVDWVNYVDVRRDARPTEFARRVADRAGTHRIWYVIATNYRGGNEGKCEAVQQALNARRPGGVLRVQPDTKYFEFLGLIEYRTP